MYQKQEDVMYYLTLENENYVHPQMPESAENGIIKGMYKLLSVEKNKKPIKFNSWLAAH